MTARAAGTSEGSWVARSNEKGEQVELGNSSFIELLHSPDRDVRRTAFQQYYQQFEAHENTLAQMSRSTCEPVTNCDAFKGDNVRYLPKTSFADRTSLGSGADQIDLYYFGRGHTDGDTFVVFRAARTVHTGDMFARKGLPFLDVPNGNGSALEFAPRGG